MKIENSILILCFSICLVYCSDETTKSKYVKPELSGNVHFLETFESPEVIESKWIKSKAKKDGVEDTIAKYDGEWSVEPSLHDSLDGDKGLVLKSRAKHHAISSKLDQTFDFGENKPLVVQYEVKFQNKLDCGGAYVKLIADNENFRLEDFYDKTRYSIMFGPDKCGSENKFHFIIQFKNPITGKYDEKHAKKTDVPDSIFSDGKTHLFTLSKHIL